MSELELTEQLDQAIDAMLLGAADPVAVSAEVSELLGIATELRALPSAEFKARLRTELQKDIDTTAEPASEVSQKSMPSKIREGFRTVTPYLTVPDVYAEIEFVSKVFGAVGQVYGLGSAGGYHSEYRIGESMVMIGGGGGKSEWKGTSMPASIHLYVPDVDRVYQRSLTAGATSLMAPTDMSYGERGAAIEDAAGNHWYIATAMGPSYVPEGVPDLMPFFNPRGAPKMIDFLKAAFAAEEVSVHKSSAGVVQHAELRIGDSIVEMGEAHGPWQPRPMHFMMYVDDCDAWYARAMKAEGAVSVSEPANMPYGRVGTVSDPFANVWYITGPVEPEKENDRVEEDTDG